MSKHQEKLQQKSPTNGEIKKGSGALDDKDIDRATGGLTLNYGRIEFKYVEQ